MKKIKVEKMEQIKVIERVIKIKIWLKKINMLDFWKD